MTTETQPEQPILSDEEENLEEVGVQPDPRRMAYKSVLVAVVIGILAISALWMFVIRQEGSPVYEAPVTEPDVQVHEDSVAKALPAAKADPVVESISRKLASMSGQIDRSFEVQQIHSTVVRQELTAMTKNIQTIKVAIAARLVVHRLAISTLAAGGADRQLHRRAHHSRRRALYRHGVCMESPVERRVPFHAVAGGAQRCHHDLRLRPPRRPAAWPVGHHRAVGYPVAVGAGLYRGAAGDCQCLA